MRFVSFALDGAERVGVRRDDVVVHLAGSGAGGDVCNVEIERIGKLVNPIRAAGPPGVTIYV